MSKLKLILITTLSATIVGVSIFIFKPKYNVYRIQLEHLEGKENEYSNMWFKDEVRVLPNTNHLVRIYSSSIEKTSCDNSKSVISEVKIYIPEDEKFISTYRLFNSYLIDKQINILNFKKQDEIYEWKVILGWALFGFFIGIVIDFIASFNRNAQKKKQQQA